MARTYDDAVAYDVAVGYDVQVDFALPVHRIGRAGLRTTGADGRSRAAGTAGAAETLGDAGTVYAGGKPNRVEASR